MSDARGSAPTPVFVHGAGHGAWCWDAVRELLPGPSIAIDLPGHGARANSPAPGDFPAYVDSVVVDVNREAPEQDVVLVGHSLGGTIIMMAAEHLRGRVSHLLLVAAGVPRSGGRQVDTFNPFMRAQLRRAARRNQGMSVGLARRMFCNDMTDEQADNVMAHLNVDSPPPGLVLEQVHVADSTSAIPRTYLWFSKDRTITERRARRTVENIGGANFVEVEAGHDGMITKPAAVAEVVQGIVTASAAAPAVA